MKKKKKWRGDWCYGDDGSDDDDDDGVDDGDNDDEDNVYEPSDM